MATFDGSQSDYYLGLLAEQERVRSNRVENVRTVLVVLSASGMIYDREAMRHRILASYPEAAIFYYSTGGKPLGVAAPSKVDLLIDLTGPGQKQGCFFARMLRRMARVAVGRKAGLFRHRIYDRIYDEGRVAGDVLDWEKGVQNEVFALAGVAMVPTASATRDRGKEIALELPPMARL